MTDHENIRIHGLKVIGGIQQALSFAGTARRCRNIDDVGVTLARRIQDKISEIENTQLDLGILDITLYRDDLGAGKQNPVLKDTEISFPIDGKQIILCDDVLFTGRTIRAAIDALMDFGRPGSVQLAVLIDRGHRELPIRPDFVGKNIPTSKDMKVQVMLVENDEEDQVLIINSKD